MSCAYRAFHAIRGLRSSTGEPTNAAYGFTNMLLKIIREQKPDALAVVFDTEAPTFRHDRFKDYKAQRKPIPEDLAKQLPVIKEIISAYKIAIVQKDGFEADDLMGSLAVKAARSGYEVYLVTSDKDMFQIVGKDIFVFRADGGVIYDRDAVKKRFGVEPKKIVDLLALAGDSSDNVPGVPGIGEKTALELVSEFGDLEGVLGNVEDIKGEKRRENINRFADQARLSRELVTLKTDAPTEFCPEEFRLKDADKNRVSEILRRLEFRKLQASVAEEGKVDKGAYRCVDKLNDLKRLAKDLRECAAFSIRLETTFMEAMRAEPVGMAFSWHEGDACYVPLNGDMGREEVLKHLRPILEDEAIDKVGHNIKKDILVLRNCGIHLRGASFDIMIAAYLLNPSKSSYDLTELALEYLNRKVTPISGSTSKGKKQFDPKELPINTACEYSCECADITFRLKNLMQPTLEKQGLLEPFQRVEMPFVEVLADMEEIGVSIDAALLEGFSEKFGQMLDELVDSIYKMAGEKFNINSPKQLSHILFDKLELPVSGRTTRGFSTNYEVLLKLSKIHPLPQKILEYRKLSKLKSTYIDALPKMVNPRTGHIHSNFNQAGTATGRLASSEPNLQNIPVRTEIGKRIREAFIPRNEQMVLLSVDYSQIDLRILAELSGDEELLKAFDQDEDIHARTAATVFGVDPSSVTAEMRRQAKTINFGIVYGMSAYGLARDLAISPKEAQEFIDRYMERYHGVRDYIEKSLRLVDKRGYVTTLLNRRRYVPELRSNNKAVRQFGRRIAISTAIQGSSADLIKIAMLDIQREIKTKGWQAAMLVQIHDELLFEVEREQADAFGKMVKEKMEGVWKLRVPLKAYLKIGENWGEL